MNRTMNMNSEVGEDEEIGQMVEVEGEEGQANSGWCGAQGRVEDGGKWRMKKVDKIKEKNKDRLDGRWWRKRWRGDG